MTVSLSDIAERAGVSIKTVSGALHGGSARMSEETRSRIKMIADELGYVTNLAARGMRQGWLPLIGVVADELITSPFATEIIRGLDGAARTAEMAVFAMNLNGTRDVGSVLEEVRRFRPRAIAYAAMYHKTVALPEELVGNVGIMINCSEANGRVTSLVPDEEGLLWRSRVTSSPPGVAALRLSIFRAFSPANCASAAFAGHSMRQALPRSACCRRFVALSIVIARPAWSQHTLLHS